MSKTKKYIPPHLRKSPGTNDDDVNDDTPRKSISSYFLENENFYNKMDEDVNHVKQDEHFNSSIYFDDVIDENTNHTFGNDCIDVKVLNEKIKDSNSLEEILVLTKCYSNSFNAINCSTSFHSIGYFIMNRESTFLKSVRNDSRFRLLIRLFLERISNASTWSVANALWCLGLAKFNDKFVIKKILRHAKRRLFQFRAQEICQLLRAIIKLPYKDPSTSVMVENVVVYFNSNRNHFVEKGLFHLSGALVELKEYLNNIEFNIGKLIMFRANEIINIGNSHDIDWYNLTKRFCDELIMIYQDNIVKKSKEKNASSENTISDDQKITSSDDQNEEISKSSDFERPSIPDEWEQDSRLSLWFSPTRQPPRSSTTPSRSDNESRISKPRDLTISKYAVFRDNTIKLTSDEEKNTDYDFDDKSATDNRLNWHFSNEENVDILSKANNVSPSTETSKSMFNFSLSSAIKKPSLSLSTLNPRSNSSSKTPATHIVPSRMKTHHSVIENNYNNNNDQISKKLLFDCDNNITNKSSNYESYFFTNRNDSRRQRDDNTTTNSLKQLKDIPMTTNFEFNDDDLINGLNSLLSSTAKNDIEKNNNNCVNTFHDMDDKTIQRNEIINDGDKLHTLRSCRNDVPGSATYNMKEISNTEKYYDNRGNTVFNNVTNTHQSHIDSAVMPRHSSLVHDNTIIGDNYMNPYGMNQSLYFRMTHWPTAMRAATSLESLNLHSRRLQKDHSQQNKFVSNNKWMGNNDDVDTFAVEM